MGRAPLACGFTLTPLAAAIVTDTPAREKRALQVLSPVERIQSPTAQEEVLIRIPGWGIPWPEGMHFWESVAVVPRLGKSLGYLEQGGLR